MIQVLIKYVVMFVGLVFFQVLILNQVQFSGYVNPYIYVLFILLLPLSAPPYLMMLLAFLIGLVVDIFSNSLGLHAASSVLIAFIRPMVIRLISDREEDRSDYPGLFQNSFGWFIGYVTILVVIHHFALFYLEVFSFYGFFKTLIRVIISSVFSIFIIVLSQFLVFRN